MNQYPNPEDIDLIDLAVVAYRRRYTISLTLVLSVLIAFGYGFWSAQSSEVVAVFLTGKIGDLEVMPTVESERLLTSMYIPNNVAKHVAESGIRISPTSIQIVKSGGGADDTQLIVLRSQTSTASAESVILVMNNSLEDLASHHKIRHDRFTEAIGGLLESKQLALSAVKLHSTSSPGHSAEGMASQLILEATALDLQTQLARSYSSELLRPATASPLQSKSLTLYAIYGAMSGLVLGFSLVFFLELLSKAKTRAAEIN